jgi:DNA primase
LARATQKYHLDFLNISNDQHPAVIAGKSYLAEHGLFDPANPSARIARKYRLGIVLDPLPGDERFRGWLAIPYLTRRGGTKAIRFRNLTGNGDAKLGQHKGQAIRIYNPEALFGPHLEIGIAEGEIDAIAATEFLGMPSVGVPGATQWVAHHRMWAPLMKDFERVHVLQDGDKAGKELAAAIIETLSFKARVIKMPDNEDVCSMLVQGRATELTKQFKDSEDE